MDLRALGNGDLVILHRTFLLLLLNHRGRRE